MRVDLFWKDNVINTLKYPKWRMWLTKALGIFVCCTHVNLTCLLLHTQHGTFGFPCFSTKEDNLAHWVMSHARKVQEVGQEALTRMGFFDNFCESNMLPDLCCVAWTCAEATIGAGWGAWVCWNWLLSFANKLREEQQKETLDVDLSQN